MFTTKSKERFLLITIAPHSIKPLVIQRNIQETISLIKTYGGELVTTIIQKREIHDKGSYIGKGKTEEVSDLIVDKNIDIVVLNDFIPSTQIYDFFTIFEKKKRNIQVWDRVDLILKIFGLHAQTAEAKLQIELAAMRHMGPRIYGMGIELSRQSGLVGTRGIGETNTELMKRHWQVQIKRTKDELNKLSRAREMHIKQRHIRGISTVSIVGYTNAGKTSLFNALTKKKKLVRNALFATLDTTVGTLYIPEIHKEVLVSDTIGFIQNLPPDLIEAFKSTLIESIHADILIHVIDVSDPDMEMKISVVKKLLRDLNIQDKKQIYVFNKTDIANGISKDEISLKYNFFNPLFISVKNSEGIEKLKTQISKVISS